MSKRKEKLKEIKHVRKFKKRSKQALTIEEKDVLARTMLPLGEKYFQTKE